MSSCVMIAAMQTWSEGGHSLPDRTAGLQQVEFVEVGTLARSHHSFFQRLHLNLGAQVECERKEERKNDQGGYKMTADLGTRQHMSQEQELLEMADVRHDTFWLLR